MGNLKLPTGALKAIKTLESQTQNKFRKLKPNKRKKV